LVRVCIPYILNRSILKKSKGPTAIHRRSTAESFTIPPPSPNPKPTHTHTQPRMRRRVRDPCVVQTPPQPEERGNCRLSSRQGTRCLTTPIFNGRPSLPLPLSWAPRWRTERRAAWFDTWRQGAVCLGSGASGWPLLSRWLPALPHKARVDVRESRYVCVICVLDQSAVSQGACVSENKGGGRIVAKQRGLGIAPAATTIAHQCLASVLVPSFRPGLCMYTLRCMHGRPAGRHV
jgi:hypothetical protein